MELLAATTIIAILIILVVTVVKMNINHFEYPICANNLKNLHTSLSTYLQDNGQWPQLPDELMEDVDSQREYEWWISTLAPYGMTMKSWTCPTLNRLTRERPGEYPTKIIHYLPSLFDEHAYTPFRLKKTPWAMEVGDMHGHGILMIYSDGSIRPYNDLLQKN